MKNESTVKDFDFGSMPVTKDVEEMRVAVETIKTLLLDENEVQQVDSDAKAINVYWMFTTLGAIRKGACITLRADGTWTVEGIEV
jgi:hypothetical protein